VSCGANFDLRVASTDEVRMKLNSVKRHFCMAALLQQLRKRTCITYHKHSGPLCHASGYRFSNTPRVQNSEPYHASN
jgi:hypothetical protein